MGQYQMIENMNYYGPREEESETGAEEIFEK